MHVEKIELGARQMRRDEQLRGYLAELLDLQLEALALRVAGDERPVDGALVAQIVEEVVGLEGLGALLLVAEDEIDPVVDALADVGALQSGTHALDEARRTVVRPRRQDDVVDERAVAAHAQVQVELVAEEERGGRARRGRVVEFGYELLDVRVRGEAVGPGLGHRMKQTIRVVEATVLYLQNTIKSF